MAKILAASLICLSIGACAPYQATSAYPPTPSWWQAHVACDREADKAAGPLRHLFGAVGALDTASTYGNTYRSCLELHGWARS